MNEEIIIFYCFVLGKAPLASNLTIPINRKEVPTFLYFGISLKLIMKICQVIGLYNDLS